MTNWADYGGVVVNNSNEELLLAFDSPVPGPWSWGHGKLPAGKRTRSGLDVDGVRPVRPGIMIEWVDPRTSAMLGRVKAYGAAFAEEAAFAFFGSAYFTVSRSFFRRFPISPWSVFTAAFR